MEEKNKHCTTHDINRADRTIQVHHITGQLVKRILHASDNNTLHNFSILREDVGMVEDIYGTIVTHLKRKIVFHKVQHVEPIVVPNYPKVILDRYKNIILCYDIMHINGITFHNTISWNVLFSTLSMIKNRKLKNLEDGINQVNKLYLQSGLNITYIHYGSEFEPLWV